MLVGKSIQGTGTWYDGVRPEAHRIQYVVTIGRIEVRCLAEDGVSVLDTRHLELAGAKLVAGIAKLPDKLFLADGGEIILESSVDRAAIESAIGKKRWLPDVGGFERSWRWALVSLALIVPAIYAIYAFAIPAIADQVAIHLPYSVKATVSQPVIEQFNLDTGRDPYVGFQLKRDIADRFAALQERYDPEGKHHLRLLIRDHAWFGANAFALPDGTIVLFTGLIDLYEDDIDKIEAVLAHEVDHVISQHGTRQVIRSAGVFLLVSVFLGDVSGTLGLASTLPAVIANGEYSQEFETDADLAAAEWLLETQGSAKPLVLALAELDWGRGILIQEAEESEEETKSGEKTTKIKNSDPDAESDSEETSEALRLDLENAGFWEDLGSSHPNLRQRIRDVIAYEIEWKEARGLPQDDWIPDLED